MFNTLDFIDLEPPTVEFYDTVLEKADPTRLPRTLSVGSLELDCFAKNEFMEFENHKPPTFWADVYGVERDEGRFYVKFTVLNERVVIYSCHFPKEDLVLQNGTIIRKGEA